MDHQDRNASNETDVAEGPARKSTSVRQPVSIRLSTRERETLDNAARDCGETACHYIRRNALTAAGLPPEPLKANRDLLAQETAKAVGLLGRITSLLNQIARVANGAGYMSETDAIYAYQRVRSELGTLRLTLINKEAETRAR